MYNLLIEGLEIYEKMKNMLNSDKFPADHESFHNIKKNHFYFLEQLHDDSNLEDTKKFYAVRASFSLSILTI